MSEDTDDRRVRHTDWAVGAFAAFFTVLAAVCVATLIADGQWPLLLGFTLSGAAAGLCAAWAVRR